MYEIWYVAFTHILVILVLTNEPKSLAKNMFSKGKVVLSCRNKTMLSIQEKELWIFDTTKTI